MKCERCEEKGKWECPNCGKRFCVHHAVAHIADNAIVTAMFLALDKYGAGLPKLLKLIKEEK